MSAFRLALGMAATALCLAAQALTGSSSLAGVVTDAISGAPVRKAAVTIEMLQPLAATATAVTDAQGRWQLTRIPEGDYQVSLAKTGYQSMTWGTGGRNRPAATIRLQPGQARGDIDFQIFPVSVISGIVYGIDGEPVSNAHVQAMQRTFPRGKPELRRVAGVATNDKGEYRIVLPKPGTYWVHAGSAVQQHFPHQEGETVPGQFYRNGEPIEVEAGAKVRGADIRLMNVTAGTITGRVEGLPAESRRRLRLDVSPRPPFTHIDVGGRHRVDADGAYKIDGVPPGSYNVVAVYQGPEGAQAAIQPVEVVGGSTAEVTLTLQPNPDILCVVSVDGPGADAVKQVTVQLTRGDGMPRLPLPRANTTPGGPCVLKDVLPGLWDVKVAPIPRGGYLKAIYLGEQDVLREDMQITPGTRDPLHISIGTVGASLTGRVKNGTPATVLLAPEGKWSQVLGFYKTTIADAKGHWRFDGAMPGAYRVYAFEEVEPDAWRDPEFLKPFHPYSALVELSEGDNGTAEVLLIPAGGTK